MDRPLLDTLGRPLEALRISVTDRCNLRCTYCMPKAAFAHHAFLPPAELLSFDELELLCRIFVGLGVRKIRLTGGEPLLRPQIEDMVARLARMPELTELAMSTNGLLLARHARSLHEAGLRRLNLSLDAIDDGVFGGINGMGQSAQQVLAGVDAALAEGFRLKVNMVVQRGVNEAQIRPMARHFAGRGVPLRFIEFMDVGNVNNWTRAAVVSGAEIRELLREDYDLEPQPIRPGETARRYRCRNTGAVFGFVDSVTAPFCRDCNRLRLSADGRIFTCLFAREGWNVGALLRSGLTESEIARRINEVWTKRSDRYSEERAEKGSTAGKIEMSYIGG